MIRRTLPRTAGAVAASAAIGSVASTALLANLVLNTSQQ